MKPKRRIVMFNRVTADGYFAAPDGNLDWVVPDEEVDAAGAAAISGFDTMTGAWTAARDPCRSLSRATAIQAGGLESVQVGSCCDR